jgi:hypothetical protein
MVSTELQRDGRLWISPSLHPQLWTGAVAANTNTQADKSYNFNHNFGSGGFSTVQTIVEEGKVVRYVHFCFD